MLQSQHGNQMWIAHELYVATCLSSQDIADHLQCCENSRIMQLMDSVYSVCMYIYIYICAPKNSVQDQDLKESAAFTFM